MDLIYWSVRSSTKRRGDFEEVEWENRYISQLQATLLRGHKYLMQHPSAFPPPNNMLVFNCCATLAIIGNVLQLYLK